VRERFGVSERWACQLVGQYRCTQRHHAVADDVDRALRAQLREISGQRPRWGYRRAHARLGQLGWTVNRKRVQRLWREAGLRVPARRRKRRRLGINADQTVAVLDELANRRGAPAHIRCDNGPELTAYALKDWCRFAITATAFLDPGAPWQNPYVESFNARVRDELLDLEQFSCLTEATVVISDWRQDYNTRRPHSALAMQTPDAFAPACRVRTEDPADKSGIFF
jgi:putative transposase